MHIGLRLENYVNVTSTFLVAENNIDKIKIIKKIKRKTSTKYEAKLVTKDDIEYPLYFDNIDLRDKTGMYYWINNYLNKEDFE